MSDLAFYPLPGDTDPEASASPFGPAPLIDRRDPAKECRVHLLRLDECGRCAGCAARRSR